MLNHKPPSSAVTVRDDDPARADGGDVVQEEPRAGQGHRHEREQEQQQVHPARVTDAWRTRPYAGSAAVSGPVTQALLGRGPSHRNGLVGGVR